MSTHDHNTIANKQIGGYNFTVGRDPTHLAPIQIEFIKDLQRRFKQIRGLVRRSVGYENDALHLSSNADELEDTDQGLRQTQFVKWFTGVVREILLGENTDPTNVQNGQHWTAEYLEESAKQGINQSIGLLLQAGVDVENPDNENLLDNSRFSGLLEGINGRYYKTFTELDGITQDMADEMGRTLNRGYQEGWNPKKMANEMTKNIRDMERTRATTLARTETQNTHTQAALRNYQQAGVEGVGHVGRMITPDDSLCEACRRLSDETFTIQEFNNATFRFRGQTYRVGIPSHPNGRCAVVPKPSVSGEELAPLKERVPGTLITS